MSFLAGIGSVFSGAGQSIGNSLVSTAQGLFSDFGNWLGDKLGISSLSRQKSASKELTKYANDLNFDTWNKQFDLQNQRQDELLYNQASMQKQGLINAGLNPAMMNQSLPTLASVSSPSGGNSLGSSAGQAQNDILPMMQLAVQSKLADSEVELNRAKAHEAESNAKGHDITNENLGDLLKRQIAQLDLQNSNLTEYGKTIVQSLKNMEADYDLTVEKKNEILSQIDINTENVKALRLSNDILPEMLKWQLANYIQENHIGKAREKELLASAGNLNAQAERTKNGMQLDTAQKAYFDAMSLSINNQTKFDDWVRDLKKSLPDEVINDAIKSDMLRSYFDNMKDYNGSYHENKTLRVFSLSKDDHYKND